MDLEDIRREYLKGGLTREQLDASPFAQFEQWMEQAIASGIADPTAMTLATVDADGQPSQRIVLLKHFDHKGFVFFTNYGSTKAKNIKVNDKVSLHFPWHMMERQVKVMGRAQKIPTTETLKYFISRPRESQIAAWASEQSSPISSKTFLLSQFESIKQKFHKGEVPLPDFWGGFRVTPHKFEYWQGGANRLHDRFQYSQDDGQAWQIERLAP